MAAYDNLRAVIAANVFQNNDNLVTADMVKTAMNEMVNSLGAEFQYGGVAEPGDNPGTPDYKVAYLASTPGTYDNFGGLVVAAGEVAEFKWDGSAWSKEVTGAATASVVDALRAATEIHDFQPIANTAIQTGKRFDANGDIQDSSRLSIYNFPVVGGNTYAFSGRYTAIVTSVYFLAWYDENGTFISREPYKSSVAADPYTVQISRQIVTAPAGAVTAKMNVQVSPSQVAYLEFLDAPALTGQDAFDMTAKTRDVVDNLLSTAAQKPLSANQGRVLSGEIDALAEYASVYDFSAVSPTSIESGKRFDANGNIQTSSLMSLYTFPVNGNAKYAFSGKFADYVTGVYFLGWYDENGVFISKEPYMSGSSLDPQEVTISRQVVTAPANAAFAKMNVQTSPSQLSYHEFCDATLIKLQDFFDKRQPRAMRVVVNADKSFRVRVALTDTLDGILTFNYYTVYGYVRNCIMMDRFYTGLPSETDAEILAKTDFQNCRDSQSPMFTANFGPLFSNHGYSTPRVNIPNHGLTAEDIGTEWYDQSGYHYTIGNISGDWIYLLPIIDTTGGPGYETRGWKWYASPYPTEITRATPGGETLQVASSGRWDYQVSELKNVRVLINGVSVGGGEYLANEVELAYEQIGYNPVEVSAWWPTPVYGGVMLRFERHFTITGGYGCLALTSNTIVNNNYPYPLHHYIDVVPMFPFKQGNFVPYVYIPKMKKVTADIDFRAEFASPDGTQAAINYSRNASDLVDVDDMPDRAYCYLKDNGGNVLFGCAGGHSLVRGMSVKEVRNNYIALGGNVGTWNPPVGNKFYNNILLTTGEADNMVPASFINEFEGYMCWYLPKDGVHTFFHKTKDGYAVYIHTNTTQAKGVAQLPDFMNGYEVAQTIEKTDGISLLTNTVIDGRLYFAADASEIQYNYIVVLVKK